MNNLQHILFLDVETVSVHPRYTDLDERGRGLWKQKIGYLSRKDEHPWTDDDYAQSYSDKAAIYAEFGKAIVITVGVIGQMDASGPALRIKSFYGHDEKEVLTGFTQLMDRNFNDPNLHVLCGHNIREFDIPYLCRRMMIQQLPLPALFNLTGKKPWEVRYIADTLEMWKFGDIKNYTSLDLLAYSLGIPSPKEQMDGSKVGHAYWQEDRLEDIRQYCERDVVTAAQVYLRLNQLPLLTDDQVVITG